MAKVLDFTTRKKQYLTVKLNDDKKTVLMIGTPTKAILDEFLSINDTINNESTEAETIDDLYNVCAKVMSFNKGGIKITADYLGSFFDIEDIIVFCKSYGEFVRSLTSSKN